jgi:thiol-disulfide isomerase/thioredoxin
MMTQASRARGNAGMQGSHERAVRGVPEQLISNSRPCRENDGMRDESRTFRGVVATVLLALGLAVHADAAVVVGDAPPDSLGKDRDGNELSLAAQHGKVVVLTFWASWCTYCLRELPVLENVQRRLGKSRVEVVAINVDEEPGKYIAMRRRLKGFELDVTVDEKHLAHEYGVRGLPHMVLVDKQGKVAFVHEGYSEKSLPQFVEQINGLLDAPADAAAL